MPHDNTESKELKQVTAERDQYKAALEDLRDYSPYTHAKQRAAAGLDLSTPFVRSTPPRR